MRRTAIGAVVLLVCLATSTGARADSAPAIAFGSGACGKLAGGLALPCSGSNFEAFTSTACSLGRNYLHPLVRDTIVDAFASLEGRASSRTWQYGETGKAAGGRLWPHKTHQNGLAADFFVPVLDETGATARLPITPLTKYGYALEFDARGRLGKLAIDWRALGDHLLALEAAGRAHRVRIERIILSPAYHAQLFDAAPEAKRLAPLFMKREAWVRHDEHYHVDFAIPAALHRPLGCK